MCVGGGGVAKPLLACLNRAVSQSMLDVILPVLQYHNRIKYGYAFLKLRLVDNI